MATIQSGDKVRVRANASDDDGRVGAVCGFEQWYGKPVVAVMFDGARWDEPELEKFYLFEVERLDQDKRTCQEAKALL